MAFAPETVPLVIRFCVVMLRLPSDNVAPARFALAPLIAIEFADANVLPTCVEINAPASNVSAPTAWARAAPFNAMLPVAVNVVSLMASSLPEIPISPLAFRPRKSPLCTSPPTPMLMLRPKAFRPRCPTKTPLKPMSRALMLTTPPA